MSDWSAEAEEYEEINFVELAEEYVNLTLVRMSMNKLLDDLEEGL